MYFLNAPTKSNRKPQTSGTVYAALLDKNFYYVRDAYAVKLYGQDSGMSFDLKNQEIFGSDVAIKDGVLYGDQANDMTVKEYYQSEEYYFLDATRHIPVNKREIRQNKYKQTIRLEEIWSHFKSEDITNDIIEDFKKSKLTQLRITYNKDYLPVKLEGFYRDRDSKGWNDLFYIDYPYKNQADFDKAQDAYIQEIEANSSSSEEAEDD